MQQPSADAGAEWASRRHVLGATTMCSRMDWNVLWPGSGPLRWIRNEDVIGCSIAIRPDRPDLLAAEFDAATFKRRVVPEGAVPFQESAPHVGVSGASGLLSLTDETNEPEAGYPRSM